MVNQILINLEKEEKSKRSRHITFKLENNIVISFKNEELITNFDVIKEGQEDIIPFKRDFNLYLKILKRKVPPHPIIKNFEKNDIKVNKDYVLMENLDEQQIIPELYEENEEDIKSLEKSMERSIDKSFDKSYERSVNMSVNQSYNQSINQSYNQSITQSYMDTSFNKNNSKLGLGGSSGGGLIQKLNKVFNESISEDKNEFEENEKEESENHENDNDNDGMNKEEENNDKDENEENEDENNEEEDKEEEDKDEVNNNGEEEEKDEE